MRLRRFEPTGVADGDAPLFERDRHHAVSASRAPYARAFCAL